MAFDPAAAHALLTELESADTFSGVVRADRGGTTLFHEAYGTASRRWNTPVTVNMRFDVASVTKLFTSVAVLQQVDAGALGLESTVAEFLNVEGTRISPNVTIRQLLTHTSGIADDADEEADESYEALWVDRPNYSVTRTADFLPGFIHKEPNFAPGQGCRYCNCGYILAGLALESVTGMIYRDYVREHVFATAGMNDSGFFDMREAVPNVAEGWEPVPGVNGAVGGWRQNIYSYPPIGSPDGGAHTTASDLALFLDAVHRGELLSPSMTELFITPQVKHHDRPGSGPLLYGFGLEFDTRTDGSIRSYYKDGVNTGVSAMLRHYPDADVTLAITSNSEDGAWKPEKAIDSMISPET